MKFKHWLILLVIAWFLFGGGWFFVLGILARAFGGV